ncbi:MAG: hypothetical protein JSW39_01420 [Desulfobacterales bacterium]|nr:MAG: hypothetical protein JSW39_01420 [Desulfobacterales bacterium]
MNNNQKLERGAEDIFGNWMQASMDFWNSMTGRHGGMFDPAGALAQAAQSSSDQAEKMWRSGNKMFQLWFSILGEPENLSSFAKGAEVLPGFMTQTVQQMWESFVEVHKQLLSRSTPLGQKAPASDFTQPDLNIFRTWKQIYQKEFQKFLNVPQLGLTRVYQERMQRFVDEANLFGTALAEFVRLFYVPIEKSLDIMQTKVEEMIEAGEFPEDPKELYLQWIKVLEGHYTTLLKSPQYTQVLNNMLQNLVKFRNARNELIYDALGNIPIPTNRDMDELYQEIYQLKKKVRELSRKLEAKSN